MTFLYFQCISVQGKVVDWSLGRNLSLVHKSSMSSPFFSNYYNDMNYVAMFRDNIISVLLYCCVLAIIVKISFKILFVM